MGIDFRGEDGFVSQHFLHHPQVGAVFYQVRRERMAEGMRRDFLPDTGGESLLHMDFYDALRPLCPSWHFTAETSLHVPPETVERAARLFDAFIADVKTLDPEIYRAYTGSDLGPVYDNLALLYRLVGPERIHVRVPLIPGYNDKADQARTVELLNALGLMDIECFPYVIREEVNP